MAPLLFLSTDSLPPSFIQTLGIPCLKSSDIAELWGNRCGLFDKRGSFCNKTIVNYLKVIGSYGG